jgi:type IV pilus assembly protein PilW
MIMARACGQEIAASRNRESGFTLVEVMSALAILAVAMTAVFATFTTQQKSFTVQSRVAEMQQNLRQAAEYMTRDIRLAGYGIPANVAIPNNVVAAGVTTMRSLYAKDNTTGPDEIYVLYLYDMDANQPPTTNTSAMPSGAGLVNVASTTGFVALGGELVLVTDGSTAADLFETSAAGGGVLTFGGGYNYNAIAHAGYGLGPPPATVAKARFIRYFIDASDPEHPTLMVDRMAGAGQPPQPLADDIEDMQVSYGLDTNADGVVDNPDPATWTSTPANLSQVRQVRLQLLARTRVPDRDWSETRPALGNHAAGAAADGYRRRVADVVIDVRNSGI